MIGIRKLAIGSLALTTFLAVYAVGPGRPVYDQISLRIALRSPTLFRMTTLLTGTMACGGETIPDDNSKDGGADAKSDAPKPAQEAGPIGSDVGKACSASSQCTLGDRPICSSSIGSTSPGSCVDTCTPTPNATTVEGCADNQGICVPTQAGGTCFQACEFDETGITVGCKGKEACRPYAFGKNGMKPVGVGICFGGCNADTDCAAGNFCNTFSGACAATKPTYTKNVGEACDRSTNPAQCACRSLQNAPTKGVCGQACVTGATSGCGAGFYCAAAPAIDGMGAPLFSVEPSGVEGNCQRECTEDAECINGQKCVARPGGKKSCDFP
jgi:hypothetical protein